MPDRPDFSPQRAVDIVANSIGTIPIEIASESIGQLAVDISSTSVGTLGIDIEAQTVSDLGIDIQNQTISQLDTAVQTEQAIDVVQLTETRTTTVPAGTDEVVTFTPPAGTIFEDPSFSVSIPGPGGTGVNRLEIGTGGLLEFSAVEFTYAPAAVVFLDMNEPIDLGPVQRSYPETAVARIQNLRGLKADEDNPLRFRYLNNTDQDNTSSRDYQLFAVRRQVG